jgi:hypothetical protein
MQRNLIDQQRVPGPAPVCPRDGSARALLPESEHEALAVTERRDPQVPFGIGSLDPLCLDLLEGLVDALDIDGGQQTRLA